MKDLGSQNIVKLIDVVRTGNNYYIVSELCTGGDLKEYMKKMVIKIFNNRAPFLNSQL